MKLTLETERLILRPFQIEDAEDMFYGWTSDIEVAKYVAWNPHESIEATKALLKQWLLEYEKPERLNFAIVKKEDNKLIGGIDVVSYHDGKPVIGYNLSRKYWNKGYMTEACKCLINYLNSQGYNEILIDALEGNAASNRVIQKCGGEFIKSEDAFLSLKNQNAVINRYVVSFSNRSPNRENP